MFKNVCRNRLYHSSRGHAYGNFLITLAEKLVSVTGLLAVTGTSCGKVVVASLANERLGNPGNGVDWRVTAWKIKTVSSLYSFDFSQPPSIKGTRNPPFAMKFRPMS